MWNKQISEKNKREIIRKKDNRGKDRYIYRKIDKRIKSKIKEQKDRKINR